MQMMSLSIWFYLAWFLFSWLFHKQARETGRAPASQCLDGGAGSRSFGLAGTGECFRTEGTCTEKNGLYWTTIESRLLAPKRL